MKKKNLCSKFEGNTLQNKENEEKASYLLDGVCQFRSVCNISSEVNCFSEEKKEETGTYKTK